MFPQAFVSYSSEDKDTVDSICQVLEENAVKCWYAPRNVPIGADWDASIMEALAASNVMVLVWSPHSDQSKQVKREVALALDEMGVTVIPYRIQPIEESKLRFFLSGIQWFDATIQPREVCLERLVQQVKLAIPIKGQIPVTPDEQIRRAASATPEIDPPSETDPKSNGEIAKEEPANVSEETRLLNEIEAIQEDTEETIEEAEAVAHRYNEERARLLAEVEALKQAEAAARKRVYLEDMHYVETRTRLLAELETLQRKISLKRVAVETARKREEQQDLAMKKSL